MHSMHEILDFGFYCIHSVTSCLFNWLSSLVWSGPHNTESLRIIAASVLHGLQTTHNVKCIEGKKNNSTCEQGTTQYNNMIWWRYTQHKGNTWHLTELNVTNNEHTKSLSDCYTPHAWDWQIPKWHYAYWRPVQVPPTSVASLSNLAAIKYSCTSNSFLSVRWPWWQITKVCFLEKQANKQKQGGWNRNWQRSSNKYDSTETMQATSLRRTLTSSP